MKASGQWLKGLGITLALSLLAWEATLVFDRAFNEPPVFFFTALVAIVSVWLGLFYGLAAIAISAVQLGFYLLPTLDLARRSGRADLMRIWLYIPTALVVCWVGARARRALHESRHARAVLEQEKKLREGFVATLTHDLRSPLTTVKALSLLLQKYPEARDMREKALPRIVEGADRADQMIQDLLDANRITAERGLPIQVERMELISLVENLVAVMTILHGDRFRVESPASLSGYWCPKSLRRILENLVSNAVKYGTPGSPVQISVQPLPQGVVIAVNNPGAPIPPEALPTLFEPFKRVKQVDSAGPQGWGLGLTLVKGLTEAHGGRVRVESDAERGTTFVVELPRDARSEEAAS
jgi:signal transduction histidine kinase